MERAQIHEINKLSVACQELLDVVQRMAKVGEQANEGESLQPPMVNKSRARPKSEGVKRSVGFMNERCHWKE